MVDSLVDASFASGNLEQLEKDLSEATVTRSTPATKTVSAKQDLQDAQDAALPDKLRGKSLAEIATIYQNLESAYGRMANDLGTQRKLTDRLLDLKRETDLGNNSAPSKVQIKSDELLENPTEALEKFTAPREQAQAQRLDNIESQMAANAFVTRHPDYTSYTNSPEFAAWVQASPIRLRAAQAAHAGDWNMAGDLLAEFKASKAQATKKQEDENDDEGKNLADASAASLESSSQGSAGVRKGGKTYSRAALMRMRIEKPETYYNDDFQQEITRAYAERRVK